MGARGYSGYLLRILTQYSNSEYAQSQDTNSDYELRIPCLQYTIDRILGIRFAAKSAVVWMLRIAAAVLLTLKILEGLSLFFFLS
uniref:Uncharacterized protein n=1 Tax=Amphimedon queenslandica TaxID=400682 RepID=A0A1X7UR00_AMPQE